MAECFDKEANTCVLNRSGVRTSVLGVVFLSESQQGLHFGNTENIDTALEFA
jgi:hypothetical protein